MTQVVGLDGCTVSCVHPDKVALVIKNAPDPNELATVSGVFRLLGDPTRARLLYALLEAGELCVCDLAWVVGMAQNLVSHHLRLLKSAGLVTGRRHGRLVMYALTPSGHALVTAVLAVAGVSTTAATKPARRLTRPRPRRNRRSRPSARPNPTRAPTGPKAPRSSR